MYSLLLNLAWIFSLLTLIAVLVRGFADSAKFIVTYRPFAIAASIVAGHWFRSAGIASIICWTLLLLAAVFGGPINAL